MTADFTKTSTDQLLRSYRFHENDRGTMTTDAECRRMYLMQEIGAELRRREAERNEEMIAAPIMNGW
jgi:hypothetical protein